MMIDISATAAAYSRIDFTLHLQSAVASEAAAADIALAVHSCQAAATAACVTASVNMVIYMMRQWCIAAW